MRKIVLASHGGLAKGMKDTIHMVLGDTDVPIDAYELVPGGDPADFAAAIAAEVAANPDVHFLVMTDVYGASVFTAMCRLLQYDNISLYTGMNVAMVLSAAISGECNEELQEIAREGVRFVGTAELAGTVGEDF